MPHSENLTILETSSITWPKSNSVTLIKKFNGAIVVFYNDKESQRTLVYSELDQSNKRFMKKVLKAFQDFRDNNDIDDVADVKVKFIASGKYYDELKEYLRSVHIKYKGKRVDDHFNFEVYFYASNNKLRISKIGDLLYDPDASEKVKVLVVDDSPTIRKVLCSLIDVDPRFEIVDAVDSSSKALDVIHNSDIDVVTLDINMPGMNGIQLLQKYIESFPIPTIMITSQSLSDSTLVLDALESGAIDYMQKPELRDLEIIGPILREKLYVASKMDLNSERTGIHSFVKDQWNISALDSVVLDCSGLIAIGASTGGTEAIKTILTSLPEKTPPIFVAQHIPEYFSFALADRLNNMCSIRVKEAENNEKVEASTCYIAPGGKNLTVIESNGILRLSVIDNDTDIAHCPNVDLLFHSVAKIKMKSIGVILTGMGSDGANGLLDMKNNGSFTIGQSAETCVVYGMPKVAASIGAVETVCDLQDIAAEICQHLNTQKKAS